MKTQIIEKIENLVPWFGLAIGYGLLALMLLNLGCARFTTTQTDYTDETAKTRQITTKASAGTFIAGKQALANWKASQTDKTQGASVGSLSQESQAADTIKATTELLKAVRPTP